MSDHLKKLVRNVRAIRISTMLIAKPLLVMSLIAIGLVFNQCGIFQSEKTQKGPEKPDSTTVIWELGGLKTEGFSYIMAVPYPQCFKRLRHSGKFYRAFSESERAVVPYKRSESRLNQILSDDLKMDGGMVLDSLMDKAERKEFYQFFNGKSIVPDKFQQKPPLVLNRMLHASVNKCDRNSTYLEEVIKGARQNYQIRLFSVFEIDEVKKRYQKWLSYQDQSEVLMQTIREYKEIRKAVDHMNFYYRKTDHQKAARAKKSSSPLLKKHPGLYQQDLTRQYTEAVMKHVKEAPTFIVADLRYFEGDNNILDRLKEKNVTVRPYDPQKQRKEQIELERQQERR